MPLMRLALQHYHQGTLFYNSFPGLDSKAYLWSENHNNNEDPYSKISYEIINSQTLIMPEEKDFIYSFSVRCVKDSTVRK